MDIQKNRRDSPILESRPHGKPLVYLDNAATMQLPEPVLQAISAHYHTSDRNTGVKSILAKLKQAAS